MIKHKHIFLVGVIVALVTIALDQLSKWYLLDVVQIWKHPPIEVTSYFNLVMVWNHGISFGMLSSQRMPVFLVLLASVIVLVLLRWLMQVENKITAISIGCVIGGALGNVIDRARFGAVADFFDFHVFSMHWPAFNIADSAIFVGVVVLSLKSMMQPAKKPSQDPV